MEKNKKSQDTQRGQSLVEFAFSLVIILILLAGIVDGGRALFTYMALRDAAQEGALYGSNYPTDTGGIVARTRQASDMLEDMDTDAIVTITYPDGATCNGNGITVRVELTAFPLAMPLIGAIVGGQTIPISADVTDTILRPPCGP